MVASSTACSAHNQKSTSIYLSLPLRCHESVATGGHSSSWTLPDSCLTRNLDTWPQLSPRVEARELLVYFARAALPVGGTQILLQDDAIPRLTRRFEAAAVSMALQWH